MSFGFGVSDFVAIGQIARKIYLSCEAAPGVFGTICRDLDSLYCVLEEAADTQLTSPLPPRREARLRTILEGCNSVLADLQFIVHKYQSLGTDKKSPIDRLKLGSEDIAEIRSRLVFNITLLTAFRSYVVGPSAFEGETIPKREYGSWQWVVELSGPETPKRSIAPSISEFSDKIVCTEAESPVWSPSASTLGSPIASTVGSPLASPRRSYAPSLSDKVVYRSETDTTTLVNVPQGYSHLPQRPKPKSRFASFTGGFSSRKKRLISNIDNKNLNKSIEALYDDSGADILDRETLDHALWSAARFPSTALMEALVERGANIDVVRGKYSVLFNAVTANNIGAVQFLLSKGVNLNFDHLQNTAIPLRAALRSESMMSLLARSGAPINTEYEVSSTVRFTILQEAISQGRETITEALLSAGAKVDTQSTSNGTALMIALAMGRESISKRLIQKGADVNALRAITCNVKYTNPVEAALLGRKPSLLEMLFRVGAVTDMPQAMRFAQANSEYPLIPTAASQYGYDYDGTRKLFVVMVMLAQRDLRYVCFFRKDDSMDAKRQGIRKMMIELKHDDSRLRNELY